MAHRPTAPALQRAQRLLQQWVRSQVTSNSVPFAVEASPEVFEPVSFEHARDLAMSPFAVGTAWGKPWHTVWFRMTAAVPPEAHDKPLVAIVDLGFSGRGDGFQVEGLAWFEGRRLQAVQPDRRLIHLGRHEAGERLELWVEAAATPIIAGHSFGYGPTPLGDPRTSGERPLYVLKKAELAVHHRETESLAVTLQSMIDLVVDSEEHSPQRARLFDLFDSVADVVDVHSLETTASAALDVIRTTATKWSSPTSHCVTAVGHAHLDTAWLWPIRETRRKAVRTFVNAVALLEENPDAVFCHSQAQHYDWVRQDAPEVFDRVKKFVEVGRWEPVGGMWVETDLNLPSGESLIRQFLQGRQAFSSWFGDDCAREECGAFLPDDFGYPGSIPQIARHCSAQWFFSQKLSWNESNRFPHHSFWWEGIDGTRLFSHFSPIETYNALLTPSQLRFAERNFSDHVGSSTSLALYGHGDGGGGPTQEMIDRGRLAAWWSDVPQVKFGSVSGFFRDAVAEYGDAAPTWVGEMYLEKHRGTYSSQIATKRGNRRCEQLLHEWELWSVTHGVQSPTDLEERTEAWRRVLTQQFHDIIPGSSIAWVHQDAEEEHRAIGELVNDRVGRVWGIPTSESARAVGEPEPVFGLANPAPVAVSGVQWIGGLPHWVDVPAFAWTRLDGTARPDDVDAVRIESGSDGSMTLANGLTEVVFDSIGMLVDIRNTVNGRSVAGSGGRIGLRIRRDRPAEYDAWDIDRADADSPGIDLLAAGPTRVEHHCELAARVRTSFSHGSSRFDLVITLAAGESTVDFRLEADWNERESRVQFTVPVDVHARDAVCGIQFGHVRRPRHRNTTWDAAQFEVCAHRYVYVSEPGCGVALLADGPRGYDVRDRQLSMTLLRSPSFPDPQADRGPRVIEWGMYLDCGPGDVGELEKEAARRAHPPRLLHGSVPALRSPIVCDMPGVLVSAIKPADDGSGDTIVRLWETRGAHASGVLVVGDSTRVDRANGLEEPTESSILGEDASGRSFVDLQMRPFEIATLRVGARP